MQTGYLILDWFAARAISASLEEEVNDPSERPPVDLLFLLPEGERTAIENRTHPVFQGTEVERSAAEFLVSKMGERNVAWFSSRTGAAFPALVALLKRNGYCLLPLRFEGILRYVEEGEWEDRGCDAAVIADLLARPSDGGMETLTVIDQS